MQCVRLTSKSKGAECQPEDAMRDMLALRQEKANMLHGAPSKLSKRMHRLNSYCQTHSGIPLNANRAGWIFRSY